MQNFQNMTLINSKQMSHDSLEVVLASDWLIIFPSMARTKQMPRMVEDRKGRQVRTRAEVHAESETPSAGGPPRAWGGGPSNLEWDGGEDSRGREVGGGGEVARVITNLTVGPDGCRGWPSMLGREELPRKKLWLTVGGKAPQKEFLQAGKVKKPQRYCPGMEALHEICWF